MAKKAIVKKVARKTKPASAKANSVTAVKAKAKAKTPTKPEQPKEIVWPRIDLKAIIKATKDPKFTYLQERLPELNFDTHFMQLEFNYLSISVRSKKFELKSVGSDHVSFIKYDKVGKPPFEVLMLASDLKLVMRGQKTGIWEDK